MFHRVSTIHPFTFAKTADFIFHMSIHEYGQLNMSIIVSLHTNSSIILSLLLRLRERHSLATSSTFVFGPSSSTGDGTEYTLGLERNHENKLYNEAFSKCARTGRGARTSEILLRRGGWPINGKL